MDAITNSDSESDGSHVSATPPRSSFASPSPKCRARDSSLPNPKRRMSQSRPIKHPESDLLHFPVADLSNVNGISVKKIQRPLDSRRSTSFSSLVRSRRPSFDPLFDVSKEVANAAQHATTSDRAGNRINMAKLRPNRLGTQIRSVTAATVPLKPPKSGSEGNFVRLNINGYGRKRKISYCYGKKKAFPCSRSWRFCRGSSEEENFTLDASRKQSTVSEVDVELAMAAVKDARVEPSDENLKKLLMLTHGYDCFREGQLEAIKYVISGESAMLVLPTGAGKSLCYQLPALVLPGVALVVSPLIALMVDQLRQLPPLIPGGLLSSNQTREESLETLRRLHEGLIKVLFISPERLLNPEFLSTFGDGLPISFVAIDEAHCISEWSHNFRPSYLRLRATLLRSVLNVQCFLAMTATATTQTLHGIMRALEIPSTGLIKKCQIRDNLQLFITSNDDRLKDLLILIKSISMNNMRSIIIYCKFQKETELVNKFLCDNNISSKVYHSSIPSMDRIRTQDLFCSNKIRVVVATVAFGMGLNKSDVDAVIHYSMPESIEEYIQETGRAGRDGRHSICHLLFDNSTYYKLRSLLYSDGVDEYQIIKLLCQIFVKDTNLDESIGYLIKEAVSFKFDIKEEVLSTVLTQLEIGDVQYIRLRPQLNVTCTMYFHKTSPEVLSNKDAIVSAIIKKSEKKHGHFIFNIPTVVNYAGIMVKELLDHMQNLKHLGEITYDLKDPAFCFSVVKKPNDFYSLSAHLAKFLSEVEKCKVQKLDEMLNLAHFALKECRGLDGCSGSVHTPCIQKRIVEYFCRDHNVHPELTFCSPQSSPYLHADIKVFLQANSHAKFTPRAVARILHGIPSPVFPSATWSKCHFWGRYTHTDFLVVMKAATLELMDFLERGET
ncbi:ATP-dependent DNA helicase Q-like 5 [Phalaenopsis equestris]|uniref:ATP-dependent DNA helicase Q-like 5 n=1 Tax=Phalaenopsis equestris TaxID=78828 RepID=UPI0009E1F59D|nr:ATP-dependent DNA helicase Q-like 5 [Phalaenopsis equestris]